MKKTAPTSPSTSPCPDSNPGTPGLGYGYSIASHKELHCSIWIQMVWLTIKRIIISTAGITCVVAMFFLVNLENSVLEGDAKHPNVRKVGQFHITRKTLHYTLLHNKAPLYRG